MRRKSRIGTYVQAAVIAAIACLLAVALGPGFARNDNKERPSKGATASSSKPTKTSKPATAGDKDGDADGDAGTSYTEDNDGNDGGTPNNVSDDGDNAHPSGKDRSVEHGGSGNQGKSESNPDDSKGPMRYEGELGDDKPNGPGGTDLADQDGNNGCGNDDDFDDDNNGWCGKPKANEPEVDDDNSGPCDKDADMPGDQPCEEPCDKDADMPGDQPCDEEPGKPCDKDANMPGDQPCVEENPAKPGDTEDEASPAPLPGLVLGDRQEGGRDGGPDVLGERIQDVPAERPQEGLLGGALPFTGGDVLRFLVLALGLIGSGLLVMRTVRASR